jgi:nucleoid-associated protein YgaU
VSSIVIEELEGQKRTLTLNGPALPLRGATWGGEMRLVTAFPPGRGGEATQQVLGITEAPSDWEGTWNTTRMVAAPSVLRSSGQNQDITRAFTLMTVFEEIIRAGALLRVTWATENRKLEREGRVGSYKFPIDREDDIRWNASFVWTSRGSGNAVSPVAQAEENIEASLRAINGTLADIQSVIVGSPVQSLELTTPNGASFLTLGQLEQIASAPRDFAQQIGNTAVFLQSNVSRAIGVVETIRDQPSQVAEIASTTSRQVQNEMLDIRKRLGRIPPETLVEPGSSVSTVARTSSYFASIGGKTNKTVQQTIAVQNAARKNIRAGDARRSGDQADPSDVIETVFVRKGDTFAGIALKYYGTADLASELARANGFPAYQVSPPVGKRIIVPAFTSSDGPTKAA